jgi:hypothetical protein
VTPLSLFVKANGTMEAPPDTNNSIGQAGSLLLSRAPLVPQFQMSSAPATVWAPTFKFKLNPSTRRRRFEDLEERDFHDKLLGLPRWIQIQELNNIFFDADVLAVYLVKQEGNEPRSNAVNESNPLAVRGLQTSRYWGAFGRCYKLAIARLERKMEGLESSPD